MNVNVLFAFMVYCEIFGTPATFDNLKLYKKEALK